MTLHTCLWISGISKAWIFLELNFFQSEYWYTWNNICSDFSPQNKCFSFKSIFRIKRKLYQTIFIECSNLNNPEGFTGTTAKKKKMVFFFPVIIPTSNPSWTKAGRAKNPSKFDLNLILDINKGLSDERYKVNKC